MPPEPAGPVMAPASDAGSLPDFLEPPVVEVVLSVAFSPVEGLRVVAMGQLWATKFRESFPKVEEQPPVQMPIERFGDDGGITFQISQVMPLPRLWFLDSEGSQLVQVQNDWFARNWRRSGPSSDYPRYPGLLASFVNDFGSFEAFVREERLGDIRATQCEVTYINHIELSGSEVDLSSVLTLVDDRPIAFEPSLESMRFAAQYTIIEEEAPVGRLHVAADPATRRADGAKIIVLTLTARGAPMGGGLSGVTSFFDLGRRKALEAFIAITRPRMRQLWGQTNGS